MLLERGFSVVALSGELTQNERTQALQALRDGRARVCVATDVAARGIDLPNLDLVIHADLPNDAEVMQHRSGRTGRAGRKGVSVLLVVPARRRRAELLLNLAGIEAAWVTAPTPDEIRKLDQDRMLRDALFTEETTEDDLVLARALLAERSPEDIAAALARLYRARLPSPEDILDPGKIDPGKGAARSRDDRGRDKGWPNAARRGSRIRSPIEAGKAVEASRHGRRQRLVPRRHRAKKECRSALAAADDLPARRYREAGHRRHPRSRHHHRVRNFRPRRRNPSRLKSSVPTRKITSVLRRWQRPHENSHLQTNWCTRLGAKAARPAAARIRTIDFAVKEARSSTASPAMTASRDLASRRRLKEEAIARRSCSQAAMANGPARPAFGNKAKKNRRG